jgi:hypothetical protein
VRTRSTRRLVERGPSSALRRCSSRNSNAGSATRPPNAVLPPHSKGPRTCSGSSRSRSETVRDPRTPAPSRTLAAATRNTPDAPRAATLPTPAASAQTRGTHDQRQDHAHRQRALTRSTAPSWSSTPAVPNTPSLTRRPIFLCRCGNSHKTVPRRNPRNAELPGRPPSRRSARRDPVLCCFGTGPALSRGPRNAGSETAPPIPMLACQSGGVDPSTISVSLRVRGNPASSAGSGVVWVELWLAGVRPGGAMTRTRPRRRGPRSAPDRQLPGRP